MKIVYYGPDYLATSDFYAELQAKQLLVEDKIYTSSSVVVLAVQVLVKEKILPWKETFLSIDGLNTIITIN